MNFLSMDYFLMTAEKRSFTKAADALHITQQTLSAHIAALTTLYERVPKAL